MDAETTSMIESLGLGKVDYAEGAKAKAKREEMMEQLQQKTESLKSEKLKLKTQAKGIKRAQAQLQKYIDSMSAVESKYAEKAAECRMLRKKLNANSQKVRMMAKWLKRLQTGFSFLLDDEDSGKLAEDDGKAAKAKTKRRTAEKTKKKYKIAAHVTKSLADRVTDLTSKGIDVGLGD